MADKNDTAGWGNCCFHDAYNILDRQAVKDWPQRKVLESRGRGRELITESIILHINPDKIVESGSRET